MTTEADKGAPAAPPTPGTPAHDAAMVSLADKVMGTPAAEAPAKPVRPEHVPEKFWNAETGEVRLEDLAKAHTELEKKLGAPPAKPVVDTDTKAAVAEADHAADSAADAVKKAGLDMNALNAEFAEKGDLTPETREKLDKAGYPKQMVDSYIAGQRAIANEYQGKAEAAAGGKEQLTSLLAWGAKNMTPAEAKAYNEAVGSGDEARMSLAIKGLRASYENAEGVKPTLINGGNTTPGGEGFKSVAEMTAAMSDKRYKTDSAYRKTVEQRVINATF